MSQALTTHRRLAFRVRSSKKSVSVANLKILSFLCAVLHFRVTAYLLNKLPTHSELTLPVRIVSCETSIDIELGQPMCSPIMHQ